MSPASRYRNPYIYAAAALLFTSLFFYIHSSQSESQKDDGYAYVIGVSQFSTETAMENAFKQNVSDAAFGYDDLNILFSSAGTIAEKQAAQIESFLRQRVDAIIVDAPDFSHLEAAFQKVREQSIPIVLVGDEYTSAQCDALVVVDYFAIGQRAGEYLLSLDPPPLNILEVQGTPRSGKSVLLQDGMREAIRKSGGRVSYVIAGYDSAITAEQRARDSRMNETGLAIDGAFIHSVEMVPGIVKVLPDIPSVAVGVQGLSETSALPGAMVLAFSGGREAVGLALGLIRGEEEKWQTLSLPVGETVSFGESGT